MMRAIAKRALCLGVGALMCWAMPAAAAADVEPFRVYLAVSGDTDATEQDRVAGWSDVRLSDAGRRQARALAALLPPTLDAIYTSSLSRAMETAQLASGRFSLISLPDLRPRNVGSFAGTRVDDPEFVRRRSRPHDSLDGGETLSDYRVRLSRAVMEIRGSLRAGSVLLVVHRSTAIDVISVLADGAAQQIVVPSPGDVAVIDVVGSEPAQGEEI